MPEKLIVKEYAWLNYHLVGIHIINDFNVFIFPKCNSHNYYCCFYFILLFIHIFIYLLFLKTELGVAVIAKITGFCNNCRAYT